MLTVIEGCDKTGKTTLAVCLAETLGGDETWVKHAGRPTDHPLTIYEQPLTDFDPRRDFLILDRWHIGEQVWPEIFDRPTELTDAVLRHIELYMRSRGAWYVWAERANDVLAVSIDESYPPEPITGEQVPLVQQLFSEAWSRSGRSILTAWNFNRDNFSDTIDEVLDQTCAAARLVEPIWNVLGGEWIGNPKPNVLLVGDDFGPVQSGRPDIYVPFTPWSNTSGEYLMEALPFGWEYSAVINAYKGRGGGRNPLDDAWEAFGKPAVIALGTSAHAALTVLRVPHESIPHPQYWRRFHHHHMSAYTTLLREGALTYP